MVPLPGYRTLADFTQRRLMPAVRMCGSIAQRPEDWSQRATPDELAAAHARQNRDLLASIDRRAHVGSGCSAVEGLSIAAISYHLVALAGYMLHEVPGLRYELDMDTSMPRVLIMVALLPAGLRHGHK